MVATSSTTSVVAAAAAVSGAPPPTTTTPNTSTTPTITFASLVTSGTALVESLVQNAKENPAAAIAAALTTTTGAYLLLSSWYRRYRRSQHRLAGRPVTSCPDNDNDMMSALAESMGFMQSDNEVDNERERDIMLWLHRDCNPLHRWANTTRIAAAQWLILYNTIRSVMVQSHVQYQQALRDEREDMRRCWMLLMFHTNVDVERQGVDLLKLEVAQRLHDPRRMLPVYQRVIARGQHMSREEVYVAFTAAPLLGRWCDTLSLGHRLIVNAPRSNSSNSSSNRSNKTSSTTTTTTTTTIDPLQTFHMASIQRPDIPDYSVLYELSRSAADMEQKQAMEEGNRHHRYSNISAMVWTQYRIRSIRLRVYKVVCREQPSFAVKIRRCLVGEYGDGTWQEFLPHNDADDDDDAAAAATRTATTRYVSDDNDDYDYDDEMRAAPATSTSSSNGRRHRNRTSSPLSPSTSTSTSIPVVQRVHPISRITRTGAVVQMMSFSDVSIAMCGPASDRHMLMHGYIDACDLQQDGGVCGAMSVASIAANSRRGHQRYCNSSNSNGSGSSGSSINSTARSISTDLVEIEDEWIINRHCETLDLHRSSSSSSSSSSRTSSSSSSSSSMKTGHHNDSHVHGNGSGSMVDWEGIYTVKQHLVLQSSAQRVSTPMMVTIVYDIQMTVDVL